MVPELLAAGHRVTVLDNFLFGQTSLYYFCSVSSFDVVRGDTRDRRVIEPLVRDADVIIPLAAIVGAPACDADQIAANSTNLGAVVDMVQLTSKDQQILIPITNSGYGVGGDAECTEDSPLNPISLYGRTKVAAEKFALDHGNAVSFRLATVFGMSPRMRVDLLVNDFVYRAVNDRAVVLFEPHFRRNFVHVRDVARVFLHGIENFKSMCGRPYNVGLSDANLSKLQLCDKIKEYVPEFVYPISEIGSDPDKRDYVVSNARIEATGWKPKHSLDDGIRELIKGYRMLRNRVHGNA